MIAYNARPMLVQLYAFRTVDKRNNIQCTVERCWFYVAHTFALKVAMNFKWIGIRYDCPVGRLEAHGAHSQQFQINLKNVWWSTHSGISNWTHARMHHNHFDFLSQTNGLFEWSCVGNFHFIYFNINLASALFATIKLYLHMRVLNLSISLFTSRSCLQI